jgi:hypothetical protein
VIASMVLIPLPRWLCVILLLCALIVVAGVVIALVAFVRWAATPGGEARGFPVERGGAPRTQSDHNDPAC